MTKYADLVKSDTGQDARSIQMLDKSSFDDWFKAQPKRIRGVVTAYNFTANPQSYLILPGDSDDDWSVVAGVRDRDDIKNWTLAKLGGKLPEGTYRLEGAEAGEGLFGWLIAQYSFDKYKKPKDPKGPRILLTKSVAYIDDAVRQASATALVRDLVNTPAADMGPDKLEAEATRMSKAYKADLIVVRGDALEKDFPMIHGVGKAAMREHAPRLIELMWGKEDHPKIAIVGKGVTFDSGGLSMKSPIGMKLMKKDMGGAAHALALAELIMASNLPVRLHMLVPAVENSVDSHALRPGDILKSRKGITVEIGNTDAEGRLVLGDALDRAGDEDPELVIDFATLTGAARVALGPDLPALFSTDDDVAAGLLASGKAVDDPVWHMPLWSGYNDMLKSPIADTNNIAVGSFAGCITAALFLKKFAPAKTPWVHFDTFAWRPSSKPGRPKGGEALGLRASWNYLKDRYKGG